jgi:ferredoxin-like protein FixX
MAVFEFSFRTGKVVIDYEKCQGCENYACIKACSLFGGNLFRVDDGKPVLIAGVEEAGRRCIEDLTCELYCQAYGNKGLKIVLNMFGLNEYRDKTGSGSR